MSDMKLHIFHKGFNYSQDGTGNRLVYHLQGCNLKCPWCANPEGMDFVPPNTEGIDIQQIKEEVIGCRPMFFDGGGVTFTGGEATCQMPALRILLQELKKENIHTAIETNGTAPALPELFSLIDELIMDLKHWKTERHRTVVGMDNRQIMKNIRLAFQQHSNLLVRVPLIGGFNDTLEDIEGFVTFFKEYASPSARFEILLYHEYGKDKWQKCGKIYTMKNAFVSEKTREEMEQLLLQQGLTVIRT